MMENPYDEEIKWTLESLEADRKYSEKIKRKLAGLEKELTEIPRWKPGKRRRINREINSWNFELQMVEVQISHYTGRLEDMKKKRQILEYSRGGK